MFVLKQFLHLTGILLLDSFTTNQTSRTRSTKTSDGLATIQAQLNNLGREIKKVNEKVYAAQVGCEQCKGPHYTKNCPLKEEGKTLKEAYYTQFGGTFQGGGYKAAASGFYQRNNANHSYQERRQSMEETLTNPRDHVKSISTTAKADSNPICRIGSPQYAVSTPQNRRLMFESRQTTIPFPSRLDDYYCEENKGSYGPQFLEAYSYGASHIDNSIPRKEKDPVSLGELIHTKLTVELADRIVKYPKGIAENVLEGIGKYVFLVDFIILDMLEDVKVRLILGILFLSTTHSKIDVFKRKITLRVGDEKILFKSMKPASSLIKRVYMLSLRERILGDQVDDLMPTIEEGEFMSWDILSWRTFLPKLHVWKHKGLDGFIYHYGSDTWTDKMA
ncbi:DNA-directed DNA polymerase [Tanacetum coccineum]